MLFQRFGRLLIPAVESQLLAHDQVVHWHHTQSCRRITATSCVCHKHDSSKSYNTAAACPVKYATQHRPLAVLTVSNNSHPLFSSVAPATIYLSSCVSYRTLPKFDTEHQQLQEKYAAKEAPNNDNKSFPLKDTKTDDSESFLSYKKKDTGVDNKTELSQPGDPVSEGKKGIFARFKVAYREYGKVLIGIHLVTSSVWFGAFYYAAVTGIDVIPLLQYLGVGESVLKAFSNPAVGDVAVAYLLYKIATPARYTVTIGGTHWTVRQLRRLGYMRPVPKGDSIRNLMKEGRSQMKEKAGNMKDRAEDVRDKIKEKTKDHVDSMQKKVRKK